MTISSSESAPSTDPVPGTRPVAPVPTPTSRPDRGFADVLGVSDGWWPVASSDQLGKGPLAVSLGDTRIALFRDADGGARALLDRCPHRRMPLSLGRIVDGGLLQCGYHGWSFDGDGSCPLIPNLKSGERPSNRIVVDAFAVVEAEGLVLVHSRGQSNAPLPAALTRFGTSSGARTSGRVEVRSSHSSIVAALAFNPGGALGLGLLLGSGYEVVAPALVGEPGLVSVLRDRLVLDLPRVSTFDSAVKRSVPARIDVCPRTGITSATAEHTHGGQVRLLVGLTPIASYRTVLRWQLRIDGRGGRALASAASAAWRARVRTGSAVNSIEAISDLTDIIRDPAIAILQRKGDKP